MYSTLARLAAFPRPNRGGSLLNWRNPRKAPIAPRSQVIMQATTVFAIILTTTLLGCGPSKPTGSEYLGKWTATDENMGSVFSCPLDIAKNGESFVVTLEGPPQGDMCKNYTGIYSLTPDGSLKGGAAGMVALSFDKASNRVALSLNGVQYLQKR